MKLIETTLNSPKTLLAYCFGCKCYHHIPVEGKIKWEWNGSMDNPTFSPSILVNVNGGNPTVPICHSFIRNGKWEYLNDCTHELAGKIIDMQNE